MNDDDLRGRSKLRNRSEITHQIKRQIAMKGGGSGKRRADLKHGIAIGWRLRGELRPDGACGARPVVYDDLLTENRDKSSRNDTAYGVGAAACCIGNEVAYGFCGITLRPPVACELADQADQYQ